MKPPRIKRLSVVLSAVAYVLFGVPVWWYTTSLHRPPLPHIEIAAAASNAQRRASLLPVSLRLNVAVPAGSDWPHSLTAEAFLKRLRDAVKKDTNLQVHPSAALISFSSCSQDDKGLQGKPCLDLSNLSTALTSSGSTLQQLRHVDDWLEDQQQQMHSVQHSVSAAEQVRTGGGSIPGHYTVFLLPAAAIEFSADDVSSHSSSKSDKANLSVGRHRHAWVTYQPLHAVQDPQHLLDLAAAAVLQALNCCFARHADKAAVANAAALPMSAAGHTHLSFSLLNANPSVDAVAPMRYTWNFTHFEQRYLSGVVDVLAPVCQVSTESRVLHYTPARIQGKWSNKHNSYVVKHSQLPFFIDSEWAIESGRAPVGHDNTPASGSSSAAPAAAASSALKQLIPAVHTSGHDRSAVLEPHVLHFLVYIPPKDHQPLLLLGPKGKVQDSNSFWIPSWGGLVVLNPDTDTATAVTSQQQNDPLQQDPEQAAEINGPSSGTEAESAEDSADLQHCRSAFWQPALPLTDSQYQHVAAVVLAQLQALFGVVAAGNSHATVPASSSSQGFNTSVVQLAAGGSGFTGWQIDALVRQRAAYDVVESCRVLTGLSKLVQELPNLEMPDLIEQQVRSALQQVELAWQYIAAGDYHAAGAAAAAARASSEAAFLHPAVLAQMNFPDSHKLGVYMPLFLPVAVPLLQGLVGQLMHFIKRLREYKQLQQ